MTPRFYEVELGYGNFQSASSPYVTLILTFALVCYTSDAIQRHVVKLWTGTAPQQIHCFLSHDWGVDELWRNNHARVAQVNTLLKREGLTT